MDRRRFCGLLVGTVLAGCLESDPSETPSPTANDPRTDGPANHLGEFVLRNDDDDSHTVTLVVGRAGTEVLNRTVTLQPDTSVRLDNPIERQGTYRVTAALEDGTEASDSWRVDRCNDIGYRQVYVDDSAGIVIREMRQTVDPIPECE